MSTGGTTLLVLLLMPSDGRGLWTKPNVTACCEEWLGMQRGWWLQGLLITSQVNMLAGTFWPFFVMVFEDTKTEHLIVLTTFLSWSFLGENPICNGTLSAITAMSSLANNHSARVGHESNTCRIHQRYEKERQLSQSKLPKANMPIVLQWCSMLGSSGLWIVQWLFNWLWSEINCYQPILTTLWFMRYDQLVWINYEPLFLFDHYNCWP